MKEFCVPASALAVEATNPESGDEVEFSVTGKVTRIEGGNVYVTAENINGEPVAKEEPQESEADALQKGAEQMDEDAY